MAVPSRNFPGAPGVTTLGPQVCPRILSPPCPWRATPGPALAAMREVGCGGTDRWDQRGVWSWEGASLVRQRLGRGIPSPSGSRALAATPHTPGADETPGCASTGPHSGRHRGSSLRLRTPAHPPAGLASEGGPGQPPGGPRLGLKLCGHPERRTTALPLILGCVSEVRRDPGAYVQAMGTCGSVPTTP